MLKTPSVAAVFVIVSIAMAAPLNLREAPQSGWGTFEDPDKDCTFKEENGVLSITVLGRDHDLAVERGKMNSPRAMQPVDGDFTIQVKVTGKFEPRQMDTMERRAYHGAGHLHPQGRQRIHHVGSRHLLGRDDESGLRQFRAARGRTN